MSSRRRLLCVGALSSVATAVWVVLAVVVSHRGLGDANEGFYLTAYRYWDVDPRAFTGVQYVYGPLFGLLHHDVADLRLVRLATVLVVHAVFGTCFMRWLRLHRPASAPTPAWTYAGAASLTAVGGIAYGWLPGTPGYNDVTLLGFLLLMSTLLETLTRLAGAAKAQDRPWGPGIVAGVCTGVIVVVVVLAKPSAVVSCGFFVVVAALLLERTSRLGGRRYLAGIVLGTIGMLVIIQVAIAPLSRIVPPLLQAVHTVSSSSHPPLATLGFYATTSLQCLGLALILAVPALLAFAVGARVSRFAVPATVVAVLLLALDLVFVSSLGALRGGSDRLPAYSSTVVGLMIVVGVVWWRLPQRRVRESGQARVVLVLLLLVPVLQAFGTNNALYAVAVNATASWVAAGIMAVTSLRDAERLEVVASAALAMVVAFGAAVGVGGMTHDERGRGLVGPPLEHVAGVPSLGSLRLPRSDAEGMSRFVADVSTFVSPAGYPVIAFGDLSRYVFALGAHPIGEAWFSAEADGLNESDLRAACAHGNPWGARQPLVLASRPLTAAELSAWRTCGVDFDRDYVAVHVRTPTHFEVLLQRRPSR